MTNRISIEFVVFLMTVTIDLLEKTIVTGYSNKF